MNGITSWEVSSKRVKKFFSSKIRSTAHEVKTWFSCKLHSKKVHKSWIANCSTIHWFYRCVNYLSVTTLCSIKVCRRFLSKVFFSLSDAPRSQTALNICFLLNIYIVSDLSLYLLLWTKFKSLKYSFLTRAYEKW